MKLLSEEEKGKYVTLVHLFDLPLLYIKEEWTESMQEALTEQYGVTNPCMIEQEDSFKTLRVYNQDDQRIIMQENDIIDCYAMTSELFGCTLHDEKKVLAEKLIHEKWNQIESSQEDIIRHRQLANTIDIITQFYITECQDRFKQETPKEQRNLSFRHVLLKTLKK